MDNHQIGDTYKPKVAEFALKSGANIVNNISGLDWKMAEVIAKKRASVIIMHMKGEPKTMQDKIEYKDNCIEEITSFLTPKSHVTSDFMTVLKKWVINQAMC